MEQKELLLSDDRANNDSPVYIDLDHEESKLYQLNSQQKIVIHQFQHSRPMRRTTYFTQISTQNDNIGDGIAVFIPIYNEPAYELQCILKSLEQCYDYLCQKSPKWDNKPFHICIIQDGWHKASRSMKKYLNILFANKITQYIDNNTDIQNSDDSNAARATLIIEKSKEDPLTYFQLSEKRGDGNYIAFEDEPKRFHITLIIKLNALRNLCNSQQWFFGKYGFVDHCKCGYFLHTRLGDWYQFDKCLLYELTKHLEEYPENCAVVPREISAKGSHDYVTTLGRWVVDQCEFLAYYCLRYEFGLCTSLFYGIFDVFGYLPYTHISNGCCLYRSSYVNTPHIRDWYFRLMNNYDYSSLYTLHSIITYWYHKDNYKEGKSKLFASLPNVIMDLIINHVIDMEESVSVLPAPYHSENKDYQNSDHEYNYGPYTRKPKPNHEKQLQELLLNNLDVYERSQNHTLFTLACWLKCDQKYNIYVGYCHNAIYYTHMPETLKFSIDQQRNKLNAMISMCLYLLQHSWVDIFTAWNVKFYRKAAFILILLIHLMQILGLFLSPALSFAIFNWSLQTLLANVSLYFVDELVAILVGFVCVVWITFVVVHQSANGHIHESIFKWCYGLFCLMHLSVIIALIQSSFMINDFGIQFKVLFALPIFIVVAPIIWIILTERCQHIICQLKGIFPFYLFCVPVIPLFASLVFVHFVIHKRSRGSRPSPDEFYYLDYEEMVRLKFRHWSQFLISAFIVLNLCVFCIAVYHVVLQSIMDCTLGFLALFLFVSLVSTGRIYVQSLINT